jgi:predicted regulator of Ras-like GTPase activity (Roadblock/LC7/MglB family)
MSENQNCDNRALREGRLVFYRDDIRVINRVLQEFLKLASARCALLVDKEGHLITKQGVTRSFDMDTISALVAGSFAATKEMARLLGEDEFAILFHQGKTDNIQLSLVGDRTLLTVIFDDSTTIGMVRLYANETAKRLLEVFEKAAATGHKGQPDEEIDDGFGSSAQTRLDDVLGL